MTGCKRGSRACAPKWMRPRARTSRRSSGSDMTICLRWPGAIARVRCAGERHRPIRRGHLQRPGHCRLQRWRRRRGDHRTSKGAAAPTQRRLLLPGRRLLRVVARAVARGAAMSRALLVFALAPMLACGGAPFVAGELATIDAGDVDSGAPFEAASLDAADADAQPLGDASPSETSPPMRDAGASDAAVPDAGVDGEGQSEAGPPPSNDAGAPPDASEAGTVDPQTYVCGSANGDGTAPDPAKLGWW